MNRHEKKMAHRLHSDPAAGDPRLLQRHGQRRPCRPFGNARRRAGERRNRPCEPWCPPCIAELPELQKLYETYADRGFNLIGVYSTEEGTASVLDEAGIGYPVLRYTEAFDVFQTGYVPTTVFLDAFGKQIGETVVGARSYEQWEEIVKELLG